MTKRPLQLAGLFYSIVFIYDYGKGLMLSLPYRMTCVGFYRWLRIAGALMLASGLAACFVDLV